MDLDALQSGKSDGKIAFGKEFSFHASWFDPLFSFDLSKLPDS
jgi:hypothetical protein